MDAISAPMDTICVICKLQQLPLRKPSDLARREIVQFVLSATGGLTGEISTLLSNAAELSIRTGDEYIGITHLEHVGRVAK